MVDNNDFESKMIDLQNVRLHVRFAGKGFPLLLLHGWPQTSYCWRLLMPALAPHFRVIAPDLRGFGDSDKPGSGYDKRTVANDIVQLVKALSYERVLVAGHDIGGRVTYRIVLDHPELVAGIITLAGRYSPLGEGLLTSKEQAMERWYFFFHHIPELPEKLVEGKESIYLEHFYRHWSYKADWLSTEDLTEYTRAYTTPGAMKGGFDHYRAALDIDPGQWSQDSERIIDTPALILWGENDPVSPLAWTKGFEKVFKHLTFKIYADCGHFIAEEQPSKAVEDIILFARGLDLVKEQIS